MSNRYAKLALSVLLPAMLLAGCSDWLTSPKAKNDPNNPTTAGRDQLLVGVETAQTTLQTGDLARTLSLWVQSMAGTQRQYSLLDNYQFDEDAYSPDWSLVYTGGGLVDIRTIESQALAVGDSVYAGVGYVLEALTMGTAADLWGDIPYSQAVSDSILTPELDPQQQVYAMVQAKLDTAIAFLQCTASTCAGPGLADLWYGQDGDNSNDAAQWTELAHTLKARFYMHTAEVDPSSYALALAQADSGISSPANDLRSWQSNDPNEWNLWFQFMQIQRSGYTAAGQFLVNLLKSTNDPRLQQYFAPNSSGQVVGAPIGGGSVSASDLSATRGAADFRQPMVTYAENQLIIAEAALHEGDAGTALAAYNAERTAEGVPTAGSVTLQDVMTEKYIALFQQIEPWNDYKRTCLPAITPAKPTGVPARLLYPLSTERNANPNIPAPSDQPQRNWNDPNPCPAP